MKKACQILFLILFTLHFQSILGQTNLNYNKERWLERAEKYKPILIQKIINPGGVVELFKDANAFQGWRMKTVASVDSVYKTSFKKINHVIVDFGNHYTGYFSMKFKPLGSTPDGPLRFKVTFAEVPAELAQPFDPYSGGVSRAWLQDEVITVMEPLNEVKLDRRVACRYLKIELLASSPYSDFSISNIQLTAVTSANKMPEPIASKADQMIKDIDKVGLNTLKECMQTVYEDGPKRDSRLWLGDLYLESIANAYSFKNYELTKRCLYLLAGLCDDRGFLHATVFEKPYPHPQANQFFMDYALLFNSALKEYLIISKDTATALELWPVAKRQLDIIHDNLHTDGLIDFGKASSKWVLFFDWKDGLNKEISTQGFSVFSLKETYELAKLLNKQDELKEVPELIKKMTTASRKLYNKIINLFESGKDKQISYASQIWMILGGVLSKEESRKTIYALINTKDAVRHGAPYMYHYFIQALINSDMKAEAKKYLVDYWGGMVNKDADTFWEVYDPTNDLLSPYNFYPVNSYCHAWSCTPVYFIRKYPEIFQSFQSFIKL